MGEDEDIFIPRWSEVRVDFIALRGVSVLQGRVALGERREWFSHETKVYPILLNTEGTHNRGGTIKMTAVASSTEESTGLTDRIRRVAYIFLVIGNRVTFCDA